MTAQELHLIALRLSNQCWCRHWLNFNGAHTGVQMAIQCMEYADNGLIPAELKELSRIGFELTPDSRRKFIYLIDRTNEDATPFESKIF